MPIKIRIDNFHGFGHIHYSLKGNKYKIKVDDFEEVFKIVIAHIVKYGKVEKYKLTEELL